jgi:hypothetical protein
MTQDQLRSIWQKTGGHCHFCGDAIRFGARGWKRGPLYQAPRGFWEVDHVIQVHKGGGRSAENCLPACVTCNRLRWHRKGPNIRRALLLGLVAGREVRKKTVLGRELRALVRQHLRALGIRRDTRVGRALAV